MGYLSMAGLGGQRLSPQMLSSTSSCGNSDRWKWVAADLVCQSTLSLRFTTSVASVFGAFCTKLISWCLEIISVFSWFYTYVAFRFFSWQPWWWGSVRVAPGLYCVSRWGSYQSWEGDWAISTCSGFCASSSIHTEKLFLWDQNQHVEHCRCCRSCCSTQLLVWPLGSDWSAGGSRSFVVSGRSREEGRQARIHRSNGLV